MQPNEPCTDLRNWRLISKRCSPGYGGMGHTTGPIGRRLQMVFMTASTVEN